MTFFLERPYWLVLILVLVPLWLHWRKGLTRQSRLRACTILTLRAAVVLLLTAALVGPVVTWKNCAKYVVCAVDVSESVPEGAWTENPVLNSAAGEAKKNAKNQCVFLPYAQNPGVMCDSAADLSPDGCNVGMTNLSAALGAATALAPEDYVPEIILFTDGTTNLGPSLRAASASVPVNVVLTPSVGGDNGTQKETWIERFAAPVSAYEGEVVGMDLFVHATHALGELKLELLRNGESVETQTLVFEKPGVRGVRFQVPVVPKAGEASPLVEWKAVIYPAKEFDLLPQNDAVTAVTRIVPHQKILLVERAENLGDLLRGVLKKEFIEVETCVPEDLPASAAELEKYGLVILSNIPASRLTQASMDALETFVSTYGGGLLVIGGDQAFTSGGYRGTPIEKLLPVVCIENENRPREGLAIALVVDRSKSMEGEPIELARQALKGALDVLGPQDQVGIQIYADSSQWLPVKRESPIWDLTPENKEKAFRLIDSVTAISTTNMNLALEKAARVLAEVPAERKHIIVMTDGISVPADFMATAEKIHAAGITISTIAMGAEAEPNLLADIAQAGEGNAYVCVDPKSMPKIFAVETASAAKIGIVEGRTPVKQITSIPGFLNFNFTKVPPLLGYVQTFAKPEARVIFASESKDETQAGDPILAWTRFGRGKVVAFTSDMESPQWLQTWRGGWPDFDRFWGRLVAHAIRNDSLKDFQIETAFHGEWLHVTLSVPEGKMLDSAPELTLPGEEPLTLLPVAPGVYGIRTKIELGRKYDLTLTAELNGQKRTWSATTLQSFTDEVLPNRQRDVTAELNQIAEATHGSTAPNLAAIFPTGKPGPDAPFVLQTLRFWNFFLLLAILTWLVELGLRRAKS